MKEVRKYTKTENAYKPNKALTKYLEEKLQLAKLEHKNKLAGDPLSKKDQKKKELNQRKRVYVLNRHVFESMANIVYFFEFVRDNSLLDDYEDEIRELLRGRMYVRNRLGNEIFVRLIDSMLEWDMKKDTDNFRVIMLSEMQGIVRYQFERLSSLVFGQDVSDDIVGPDLYRAFAWTRALAQRKETYRVAKPQNHHRPVLF